MNTIVTGVMGLIMLLVYAVVIWVVYCFYKRIKSIDENVKKIVEHMSDKEA